jgi:hypothetical protein
VFPDAGISLHFVVVNICAASTPWPLLSDVICV